jgi:hypothetical protein
MEQTECSETSARKLQTPINNPRKAYDIQNTAKVCNQECVMLGMRADVLYRILLKSGSKVGKYEQKFIRSSEKSVALV